MKKICLLLFLFIPSMLFAQFKLTIDGFVDEKDTSKNYIVYEFEDKSQESLYNSVLMFINKTYRSPKDVINEVKPEMVTISGFQEACISVTKPKKVLGNTYSAGGGFDLSYNMSFRFKEGKIRIDAPSFECKSEKNGRKSELVLSGSNGGLGVVSKTGLFKKNGEPSREHAIKMLEDFFNAISISIKESISDESKDNW